MADTLPNANRKLILLGAVFCLTGAAIGGFVGIMGGFLYSQDWFRTVRWVKFEKILNYPLTTPGVITGLCCGLVAGYVWVRFMMHRTRKFRQLDAPRTSLLVGEGMLMGLTLGWVCGAVHLIVIHGIAISRGITMSAKSFFTFMPITIAASLFIGLTAGLVGGIVWWMLLRTGASQNRLAAAV
ncbi:MAG: hypothetical protein KAR11_06420 [Phycisphaerae bacterium]|nr:hypothetical protein [Phycisphaerae bacterium]